MRCKIEQEVESFTASQLFNDFTRAGILGGNMQWEWSCAYAKSTTQWTNTTVRDTREFAEIDPFMQMTANACSTHPSRAGRGSSGLMWPLSLPPSQGCCLPPVLSGHTANLTVEISLVVNMEWQSQFHSFLAADKCIWSTLLESIQQCNCCVWT